MAGGKFQVRLKAGDSEIEVEGERPIKKDGNYMPGLRPGPLGVSLPGAG